MGPAGEREKEILTAVVETFIATGEPVGSRTLSRGNREGLSAATIRNVMADLSDAGFLEQPHTSAGRIQPLKRIAITWNNSLDRRVSRQNTKRRFNPR